jgi:pyruvate dehydrogenase E2 component (dihydrolipoamide acetyltransferase)
MSHEILAVGAGGEYMESVTVVEWLAKEGDHVNLDDVVVVVETAKASTEILATGSGILSRIVAAVGDEVDVGSVLGYIGDIEGLESSDGAAAVATAATAVATVVRKTAPADVPVAAGASGYKAIGRPVASPLARRIALELGMDLSRVQGSAALGRIKARDVLAATKTDQRAAVVFVHGFGSDARAWQKVQVQLPRGLRVLALDLPAHGANWQQSASSLSELTDAIEAELLLAGVADAHLIGHSLGGAVCLELIKRGKVKVGSLALLAPVGLGAEIDGAFIQGFSVASDLDTLKPWLGRLVASPEALPKGFAEETLVARENGAMRSAQQQLGAALFAAGQQSITLRDVFASVTVPTKVIWGLEDAIIPWKHGLGLPGAVGLHLLEATGHMPHLEQSKLVGRLLAELLRSAP